MHACIHTYIHAYIQFIHAYIHTYIHTYIYTYMHSNECVIKYDKFDWNLHLTKVPPPSRIYIYIWIDR